MTANRLLLRSECDQCTSRDNAAARPGAAIPSAGSAAPIVDRPQPSGGPDSYSVTALTDMIDRELHAVIARANGGLAPPAVAQAYWDWATHLAYAPGKRLQLVDKALRKTVRLNNYALACLSEGENTQPCIDPLPRDRRFVGQAWQAWPYNVIYQAFLLQQQWWHNATTGLRGVTRRHEQIMEFMSRQLLDVVAPSNLPWANPEIIAQTISAGGTNLIKGLQNFVEDWERMVSGKKPAGTEKFAVGRNVAVTPGKVVYRNRLIELIQYSPASAQVRPEPILVVPAWIMKYYILDLSPHNSLVKYLVESGFTVFMISWKNPGPDDRDLGMEDYRTLGVISALDVIGTIVPNQKVHAAGYCLGGTLLAIASAALARDGDERLATLTLLAAQTDFSEAGELMLFIDESQIAFLEDMMYEQGFLDSRHMAGAFQMLRSNDLVWSRIIHDYLLGQREPLSDLMAWSADATRMPYRMHSEYLRELFLENQLIAGHFIAAGKRVALTDLSVPIFAVGTEYDHVAPWQSTYKINLQTESEVTYLLTSGGHNTGIISVPGTTHGSFRVAVKKPKQRCLDSEQFLAEAQRKPGSWWPHWTAWLERQSGPLASPPKIGGPNVDVPLLADAPGAYVMAQ